MSSSWLSDKKKRSEVKWPRWTFLVLVAAVGMLSAFAVAPSSASPAAAPAIIGSQSRYLAEVPPGDLVVYRTHGPEETADILATGRYRVIPGTNETKNFFETEREARALAKRFESFGIVGPYSISTGVLPAAVAERAYRVDIGLEGIAIVVGLNDVPLVYDARIIGPVR